MKKEVVSGMDLRLKGTMMYLGFVAVGLRQGRISLVDLLLIFYRTWT